MSNALNAKLSKLVYAPISHDHLPGHRNAFERLIMLMRQIYQVMDETHGWNEVCLRIHCNGKAGLVTLTAAPSEADSGSLRLQRWDIYQRIATLLFHHEHLTAALAHVVVEGAIEKAYGEQVVNQLINKLDLATAQTPEHPPKQRVQSIITHHGKSLSKINTQVKTELYSAKASGFASTSRFSNHGYKQK